jgi:hypothetical protein
MKFMLLGVFVFFFVALPLYVLDTLVMPQLTSLGHGYAHQEQTVQSITLASR